MRRFQPISLISLVIKQLLTLDTIIALGTLNGQSSSAKQLQCLPTIPSQGKGKGDLFAYLESLRELFLPNKPTVSGSRKIPGFYIVEARSSLPEIQAKQDNADRRVSIQSRSTTD